MFFVLSQDHWFDILPSFYSIWMISLSLVTLYIWFKLFLIYFETNFLLKIRKSFIFSCHWDGKDDDYVHLSQHKYVKDFLYRTRLRNSKHLPTHVATSKTHRKFDGATLLYLSLYLSIFRDLQYYTMIRPNISCIVNKLCQFFAQPIDVYWLVAKWVLRYLNGTNSYGLWLQKLDTFNFIGFYILIRLEVLMIENAQVPIV